MMKRSTLIILVLAMAMFLTAAPALAYIDPGTGSFLVQGIIAAVVGAGFAIKLFWHRIKAAITGKPIETDDDDDE